MTALPSIHEGVRRLTWGGPDSADPLTLLDHEWLVTNGLGGSASGTVAGVITRRHHGLLVAALPAPHGRTVMLSHLYERLRLPDGSLLAFGGDEREGDELEVPAMNHLVELRLEQGLPIWRYDVQGYVLEKLLLLPHLQNTVQVTYRLLSGLGPARLELRPSVNFRPHEDSVSRSITAPYTLTVVGQRHEIAGPPDLPPLRLFTYGQGSALTLDGGVLRDVRYRVEADRGYESRGALWSPGYFSVDLIPAQLVEQAHRRGAPGVTSSQMRPDVPATWENVAGQRGDVRPGRRYVRAHLRRRRAGCARTVRLLDEPRRDQVNREIPGTPECPA